MINPIFDYLIATQITTPSHLCFPYGSTLQRIAVKTLPGT